MPEIPARTAYSPAEIENALSNPARYVSSIDHPLSVERRNALAPAEQVALARTYLSSLQNSLKAAREVLDTLPGGDAARDERVTAGELIAECDEWATTGLFFALYPCRIVGGKPEREKLEALVAELGDGPKLREALDELQWGDRLPELWEEIGSPEIRSVLARLAALGRRIALRQHERALKERGSRAHEDKTTSSRRTAGAGGGTPQAPEMLRRRTRPRPQRKGWINLSDAALEFDVAYTSLQDWTRNLSSPGDRETIDGLVMLRRIPLEKLLKARLRL